MGNEVSVFVCASVDYITEASLQRELCSFTFQFIIRMTIYITVAYIDTHISCVYSGKL
jgi:hypothetical protein